MLTRNSPDRFIHLPWNESLHIISGENSDELCLWRRFVASWKPKASSVTQFLIRYIVEDIHVHHCSRITEQFASVCDLLEQINTHCLRSSDFYVNIHSLQSKQNSSPCRCDENSARILHFFCVYSLMLITNQGVVNVSRQNIQYMTIIYIRKLKYYGLLR